METKELTTVNSIYAIEIDNQHMGKAEKWFIIIFYRTRGNF